MKLLLTGLPRTGKTTLFQKLIPLLNDPFWVISEEIRNEVNKRIGFKAETHLIEAKTCASSRGLSSN